MSRIFPEHADCIEEVAAALTVEEQQQVTRLLRDLGRHAADDLKAESTSQTI